MGRGMAPWPGAGARRFRSARGLLALVLTPPAAALAVGCGSSGTERPGPGDTARPAASAPAPAPAPRSASASTSAQGSLSPEELCTSAVGHWAHDILAGSTPYGDYQSMGLSNAQYDILRKVVDAAQAAKRDQGPRAAGELIDRQVRDSCAEHYRSGAPGDGPWQ
ncbi:hypothetical protein KBY55_06710 [Streptomyces sp. b94]|uniref:hypothetical protein n=1 Tax=Streptomyces sp. b94 TaxID=1827634 RepID=UPI001B377A43|nr:hypothetical protein [Streptomyces sp. b94]MBQ1095788.1 hypothetical protein [Streptomyces sp. b94]